AVARGANKIAAQIRRVAAGRGIGHVLRLDARVRERDRLRARVVRQERNGESERAHRPRALQELAPVDAPMAGFVVEIEDLLVDFSLRDEAHWSSPWLA